MTDKKQRKLRRNAGNIQAAGTGRPGISRGKRGRIAGWRIESPDFRTLFFLCVSLCILALCIACVLLFNKTVRVPDPVLKKAIQEALDIGEREITEEEALKLTELRYDGNAHHHEIKDLRGLSAFKNLETLDVHGNDSISDLRPLKGLSKLKNLDLHGNFLVSDLSPLAGLGKLEKLDLERVYGIRDLSPLEKISGLKEINLCKDYFIEDLSPLRSHSGLRSLNLSGLGLRDEEIGFLQDFPLLEELQLQDNRIEDLSSIEVLQNLEVLNLMNNQVSDPGPIRSCRELKSLNLAYNRISGTDPLAEMTEMEELDLRGNTVTDLAPLENMTGMTSLQLDGNVIGDIEPLRKMTGLEELSLYGSGIKDISALSGMIEMKTLKLQGNPIGDLSALAEMTEIESLNLADTGVSDLSSLWGMTQLTRLEIWGNDISDIAPLTNMEQLERLEAADNQIWSIEALRDKEKLEYLELDGNNISDLSALEGDRAIELLYLSRNRIEDVTPLSGLEEMFWLELTGNPVEDLSPVLGLEKLECLETDTPYPSGYTAGRAEKGEEEDRPVWDGLDGRTFFAATEIPDQENPGGSGEKEDQGADAEGDGYDLRVTSIYPGEDNEGDAVLLQSEGYNLLMDTGMVSTDRVIRKLKDMGVSRLDIYLSHWHDDHYGQILTILDDPWFTVGRLYLPESKAFTSLYDVKKNADQPWWKDYQRHYTMYNKITEEIKRRKISVTWLKKGSKFKIGSANAEVLYQNEDPFLDESLEKTRTFVNNTSLVTMITSKGGLRYLTCGDIETETEEEILEKGIDISCDLFKMNHHGSSTSNTQGFLEAASPSCAFYNIRGQVFNKRPYFLLDTVTRLIKRANVFCGGTNGDLVFDMAGSRIEARAQTRVRAEKVIYRDEDGKKKTQILYFNADAPGYLDACLLPEGAEYISGGSEDLEVRVERAQEHGQ